MNRPQAFPMSDGDDGLAFLRLLWAVDHGMQQRSRQMGRELGVTGLQRIVLRVVGDYPDLTLTQLAAVLHLHPSTVTDVAQRLQRQRFVVRRVDAADRRRSRLVLTERGRTVSSRRAGTVEASVQKALAELSPEDIAAAERVLSAIGRRLSGTR